MPQKIASLARETPARKNGFLLRFFCFAFRSISSLHLIYLVSLCLNHLLVAHFFLYLFSILNQYETFKRTAGRHIIHVKDGL